MQTASDCYAMQLKPRVLSPNRRLGASGRRLSFGKKDRKKMSTLSAAVIIFERSTCTADAIFRVYNHGQTLAPPVVTLFLFRTLSSYTAAGSLHSKRTRPYKPEALSTEGDCYNKDWVAINYTKLYNPEPDYQVITESTCSRYHFSKGEKIDSSYGSQAVLLFQCHKTSGLLIPHGVHVRLRHKLAMMHLGSSRRP